MAHAKSLQSEANWHRVLGVITRGGQLPHDALHVTAVLEMAGYSDRRAREEFGYTDLFEMSQEVYRQVQMRMQWRAAQRPDPFPWYRWMGMGALFFLRGMMFAMPMVVSILAMLLLRYSLWSYTDFGPERATGIALGTMGSFLVTGGFTQAIARRGLFYISQKEYALARRTTLQMMVAGMVIAVGLGLAFVVLNAIIPFFPSRMIVFAGPYYLFLCLLWLTITILYMLRQEILFTAITVAGIVAVWFLYGYKGWMDIQQAQMLGLGLSTAVSLVLALWLFARFERLPDSGLGDAQLPRWSQVARALVPYFAFGVLYFAFLFLDRVLAWSVPSEVHPFPIWFLGDYELGLDWAILTLVWPMGLLELAINVFSKRLEYWAGQLPADQWQSFNERFQAAYRRQLTSLIIFSAAGAWMVWLCLGPLEAFGLLDVLVLESPVTSLVFFVGSAAYVFVSAGLLNCLVLFSLNYPWPAVQGMATALLVNLGVGFLMSRQAGYAYASFGLLAGSVTFAILSTRQVYRQLGRLDFMLFRSA